MKDSTTNAIVLVHPLYFTHPKFCGPFEITKGVSHGNWYRTLGSDTTNKTISNM